MGLYCESSCYCNSKIPKEQANRDGKKPESTNAFLVLFVQDRKVLGIYLMLVEGKKDVIIESTATSIICTLHSAIHNFPLPWRTITECTITGIHRCRALH